MERFDGVVESGKGVLTFERDLHNVVQPNARVLII